MPKRSTGSSRRKTRKETEDWGISRNRGNSKSAVKSQPIQRPGRSSRGVEPEYPIPTRTRAPRKKKVSPERFSILDNISPERRMDLLGVILVIVGLLTALGLFTTEGSAMDRYWAVPLSQVFGWGIYLLTIALIVLGIWLVARNVERLPALTIERVIGIIILFSGLLVSFHALGGPVATAQARAEQGTGGGYIGYVLIYLLVKALGGAGTGILLVAWLIVGLAMTLDLSMQQMFSWVGRLWMKGWERWKKPSNKTTFTPIPVAREEDTPGNFKPVTPSLAAEQATQPAPAGVTIKTGIPSTPTVTWTLPRISDILDKPQATVINEEFIEKRARLIEETLVSFGAPAEVVEISRGPAVTMYGVEPKFIESRGGPMRVRVGKIAALSDDLALALAVQRIRIQAPVPGRGYVGIEVPNEEMSLVALREIVESEAFSRGRVPLRIALGKDVAGHPKAANLETMPHLLIAGTTGSGKSVCVNSILTCLLLHNTPDDLRLILVDPKRVELTGYNGVPHLMNPVVVEIERVVGALQWMTREMDKRYQMFSDMGARNITDYNARITAQGGKKLHYLIIVVDELADLMMKSPEEAERTITRLAQLARATGIHMILATQRPSVDVVTGLIKANFPARIAFAVATNTDSRVILDQPGAERLLGRGDMLYQAPDAPAPVRYQGVFVSEYEINRLVNFWKTQAGAASPYAVPGMPEMPAASLPRGVPLKQDALFEDITTQQGDPLLGDAIDTCRREGRGSVSMLQRKLRIGYTRAARMVDTLEEKGILGPPEPGTGVRAVLDYGDIGPPKEE